MNGVSDFPLLLRAEQCIVLIVCPQTHLRRPSVAARGKIFVLQFTYSGRRKGVLLSVDCYVAVHALQTAEAGSKSKTMSCPVCQRLGGSEFTELTFLFFQRSQADLRFPISTKALVDLRQAELTFPLGCVLGGRGTCTSASLRTNHF
ncbi:hypothetical protein CORC01_13211 [Colletotrichum orchidophilum]|uniref:Uncharacterized protein n=1 Tax=Colletotrichum orchidophilum TaxID=1209926 RepID=A0A1G4AQM2_9PEZI|nr:uncharacterized protein CORC01_13211 [Colletotrichum orchidophilum]OHE91478.1 hypothetical protein CORC01_13211 [Colletotrichum orchidophilum]